MRDQNRTKKQLIDELKVLRQRVADLEAVEVQHTERKEAEEALRLLVEGTTSTGEEFFRQLVRSLAAALQVRFAFISELADPEGSKVRLLSFWVGTGYGETFEYATKDTPCEEVVGKGLALYPDRVTERFPKDVWLREAGVESYLAIPLFDSVGNPLGHMGVMHDQPLEGGPLAESILRIFAARAGSELERERQETVLKTHAHVLESMAEGVNTTDLTGKITFTNSAFDKMFGYERGELIGKHVSILNSDPPEENARIILGVIEHLQTHGVWVGEFNNRRKDGTLFITQATISALELPGGTCWISVQQDITERKQMELALRRYESMVSASSDLMVFVDPTYTYRAVNPAYCDAHEKTQEEILGYTVAEVLGQKLFETQIKPRLDRCLSGERVNFEVWWDFPGRGRRHVDARYDPFYDADGSVSGVLADVRDTTDSKQVEQALRESEHKYKSLINQSPDPIFVSRIDDFMFTEVNERACTNYGYTQEEFLTMNIFDIEVQAPLREQVRDFYDETEVGQVVEVHGTNKRKDGSTFPVHVRFTKLDDEFALAVVRDITQRKQAEEKLQESERRFRALFEQSNDAVALLGLDGVFLAANDQASQFYGYEVEELVGMPFEQIVVPHQRGDATRKLQALLAGATLPVYERLFLRKDGSEVPGEVSVSLVRDEAGSPLHVQSIVRDITERRRLERDILEASVREQRRIGQDLHDGLGQHLTGIAFLSEALERKLARWSRPEAADAKEIGELTSVAIARTRTLAKGLYPVVLDTGGFRLALEELLLNTAQWYDVHCVQKVDDALSVGDATTAAHLYYIVQEAVSNAVNHGKAGHITIELRATGDAAKLTVTDDGVGFSDAVDGTHGMGTHIMRYRAGMIDGSLDIGCTRDGKTEVVCSFPAQHAL